MKLVSPSVRMLLVCLMFIPLSANAYIGPGAGLGAILIAVAVVLGLGLLFVGFFWYPIKRMLSGKSSDTEEAEENTQE